MLARARHALRAHGPKVAVTALAVSVVLALLAPATAHAIRTQGQISVTLSDTAALRVATYTIERFRTDNNETITGYTIAFPAGTDVSGATSAGTGDSVAVVGPSTIRVTLGTAIGRNTTFSIVIDGIRNPVAAGSYRISQVTFHRPNGDVTLPFPGTEGSYTVTPEPFLAVSISTNSVVFDLYPEAAPAPQQVQLSVESSHDFSITRQITGDAGLIGLIVDGTAVGPKTAGVATFTDTFTADVPWTTEGERSYTATVTYTVVQ